MNTIDESYKDSCFFSTILPCVFQFRKTSIHIIPRMNWPCLNVDGQLGYSFKDSYTTGYSTVNYLALKYSILSLSVSNCLFEFTHKETSWFFIFTSNEIMLHKFWFQMILFTCFFLLSQVEISLLNLFAYKRLRSYAGTEFPC